MILSIFFTLGLFSTLAAQENPCSTIGIFENEADGVPAAPTICSNEFASENEWYAAREGVLWWNLSEDVIRVAYALMDLPDAEPSVSAPAVVENVTLEEEDLHEGTQYLAVQFKNAIDWGAVGYYRIQIDTSAPQIISVTTADHQGDVALVFNATDAVSYVAKYDLSIDGGATTTLSAEEVAGGYPMPDLAAGTRTLTVTAYDAAGNQSTVTTLLSVPERMGQKDTLSLEAIYDQYVRVHHLILLLAVIMMGCIFFYILAERRRYNALATRHARELAAVYKNAEENFAALRAELYRNFDDMKVGTKKKAAKKTTVRKSVKKAAKKAPRRTKSDV